MKTTVSFRLCLVLGVTITALPGCQKIMDKYAHLGGKDKAECRIRSFVSQQFYGTETASSSFNIYYDSRGNPESASSSDGNSFSFKYADDGRLKEYKYYAAYAGVVQSGTHWYWYSGNRIVKDSSWDVVEFIGEMYTTDTYERVSYITYDSEGRVSKDSVISQFTMNGYPDPYPITNVLTYSYDTDQNLILFYKDMLENPTSERITYDQKKSYLRTNSIWMFLARNYSRNNETGAVGYNNKGYPLGFMPSDKRGGTQSLTEHPFYHGGNPLELTYDCK